MNCFNAYTFYEQILDQIAHVLPSQDLPDLITQSDGFVSVARVGFATQHRNVDWNEQCTAFAHEVDQGPYGLEALANYEEWTVGICCFAAFSIGA